MVGLTSIQLDDRDWEQLKDDLIRRIPTHSTVWKDHNPTDPGIVLIELFAALGENLLERMNQMPEKAQREFLNLLNIPLKEAQIAETQVCFSSESPRPVKIPYAKLTEKLTIMSGDIGFQIMDELTVLPIETIAFIKQSSEEDPKQFIGIEQMHTLINQSLGSTSNKVEITVAYYETKALPEPEVGILPPVMDLQNSIDQWLWIALLAPEKQVRGFKDNSLKAKLDELRLNCAGNTLSFAFQMDENLCGAQDHQRCPDSDSIVPTLPLEWEIATGRYADGDTRSIDQIIYSPLKVESDHTHGLSHSGILKLRLPRSHPDGSVVYGDWLNGLDDPDLAGVAELPPKIDDKETNERLLTWIRVRRPNHNGKQLFPSLRLHHIAANCVAVKQLITAKNQLLGYGNGQSYQIYRLNHTPVIKGTEMIQVREAGQWKTWHKADNLNQARADDRFYAINLQDGLITFGDGVHGRIPRPGEAIRCLTYQYGGGVTGNVPAESITKIRARGKQLKSLKAINLFAAKGGVDAETDIEAVSRIPEYLHHRDRAVAKDDFRKLALETPNTNLGRVEVLARHKPHERIDNVPGVVTLILVPAYDPLHPNEPIPDKVTINRVCEYLDARRLVTTELYLTPATYIPIYVSAAIEVEEGYGIETVNSWVELAIRQYFAPLPPYGPAGMGWPFGRTLRKGDIEVAIMRVEGVRLVYDVNLQGKDDLIKDQTSVDKINLFKWELPVIKNVQIKASSALSVSNSSLTGDNSHELAPEIIKQEQAVSNEDNLIIPIPVEREQC